MLIVAILAFNLVVVRGVFAVGDFAPNREARQEKLQTVKDKAATRQADIRARQVGHLKNVFTNILSRFQAALERLDKIVDKLNSRIDKLNAKGVDTTSAETKLASCSAKKTLAQNAINDAKAKVAAIDPTSSTVRAAVQTAVSALHTAKAAIRDYHKCLVDVTRSLKASLPKEGTESAE